jgi:O-methyltransferase
MDNKTEIIENLLTKNKIISNMVTKAHIENILLNLETILTNKIEGDIVELGCNVGTTSLFIRKLLDYYKSDKKYHVYDSFEGLPEKTIIDESEHDKQYKTGSCKTSIEIFKENFNKEDLQIPIIHVGWFKEIPDEKYPEKIAFAFFDGDFYTSILDSFEKVYHKLEKGAVVLIHDYDWDALPGVKKACDEFLQDKPETIININNISLGLLVKQ